MTQMVTAFYNNILQNVMEIESRKKKVSRQILLSKDPKKRQGNIYIFLSLDIEKHRLLEHAAVVAINNREITILDDLQKMYSHCEQNDIVDKIRQEIKFIEKFQKTLKKVIKYPDFSTFSERRMIQEISKYVVEQARLYNS